MSGWDTILPEGKHMLFGDTASDITSIASAVATIVVLILQIIARNKQQAIHADVKELKQTNGVKETNIIVPPAL